MKYLILLPLSLVGLVLQSTLFNHITVAGVKPDLILILALFYSIFQGPQKGLAGGFFLGLLEDLYFGRFIGMNALTKGVTAAMVGWITRSAFKENFLVPIISVFVGTLVNQFIYLVLGKCLGFSWEWGLWLWKGLPLAVYNMCLVPLIYAFYFNWATEESEENQVL